MSDDAGGATGLPFAGLKVVDFSHVLAAPACSYYLGLLGAEVVKVESPRGDAMRHRSGTDADAAARGMSTAYRAQGAGKTSRVLDLETATGRAAMHDLLARADVFVENHRPPTLKRLELDEETTLARHPRLIHCAMTGYGRGGPLADAPAYDVNIQAASGLMALTGTREGGPTRVGAPVVDYATALAAAFGVSAALFARERTGRGTLVDVSMLDTALALMASTLTDHLLTGHVPERRGNAANSRSPAAGSFSCREGTLSLGVNEEAQFHRLARVVGRECWLADPRFRDRVARDANRAALSAEIETALAARTAAEWETLMQDAAVPAARLRTLPEALAMEQVAARGVVNAEHAAATLPFKLGGKGFAPRGPAPGLEKG